MGFVLGDRKRDATSALGSSSALPSKKNKVSSSGSGSSKTSSSSSSSGSSAPSHDAWESLALDVDIPQLSSDVIAASEADDSDKVVSIFSSRLYKYSLI